MLIMNNVHNYGMVLFSFVPLVRELRSITYHISVGFLHRHDIIMLNLQKVLIIIRPLYYVSCVSIKDSLSLKIPYGGLTVSHIP